MSRTSPRPPGRHTGQAAIELVALVPAIVVVALRGGRSPSSPTNGCSPEVRRVPPPALTRWAPRAGGRAHRPARGPRRPRRVARWSTVRGTAGHGDAAATRVLPWMPRVPVTGRPARRVRVRGEPASSHTRGQVRPTRTASGDPRGGHRHPGGVALAAVIVAGLDATERARASALDPARTNAARCRARARHGGAGAAGHRRLYIEARAVVRMP